MSVWEKYLLDTFRTKKLIIRFQRFFAHMMMKRYFAAFKKANALEQSIVLEQINKANNDRIKALALWKKNKARIKLIEMRKQLSILNKEKK